MCTLDYYKELVDELDDIIRVKSKSGRIYKNLGKYYIPIRKANALTTYTNEKNNELLQKAIEVAEADLKYIKENPDVL